MSEMCLVHHGILGQKWGIRRFQPYPSGEKVKGGKEVGQATKVKQRGTLNPIKRHKEQQNTALKEYISKEKEVKRAKKDYDDYKLSGKKIKRKVADEKFNAIGKASAEASRARQKVSNKTYNKYRREEAKKKYESDIQKAKNYKKNINSKTITFEDGSKSNNPIMKTLSKIGYKQAHNYTAKKMTKQAKKEYRKTLNNYQDNKAFSTILATTLSVVMFSPVLAKRKYF